jgi:hypothetical protein
VSVKVRPVEPTETALGATDAVPSPPTGVRVDVGDAVGVGVATATTTVGCTAMRAGPRPMASE